MKIGEIEYTNLTDDFGYWTVEVKDIRTYLPINISDQPNLYNPFTAWSICNDVKYFMEDVIRKVAIPEGEQLRSIVGLGNYYTKSRYTFHKFHHIHSYLQLLFCHRHIF